MKLQHHYFVEFVQRSGKFSFEGVGGWTYVYHGYGITTHSYDDELGLSSFKIQLFGYYVGTLKAKHGMLWLASRILPYYEKNHPKAFTLGVCGDWPLETYSDLKELPPLFSSILAILCANVQKKAN